MHTSVTYRLFVKATALLLLIGATLPPGLQAKELIDFCLDPVEETTAMKHDHSCCPSDSEEPEQEDATQHECEWNFICACHIDRALLSGETWTTPKNIHTGLLTEVTAITPENHSDRYSHPTFYPDTYSTPPIFLLNSTFLN